MSRALRHSLVAAVLLTLACASIAPPPAPKARFVAAAAAFEGAANVAYAYGRGAAATQDQRELLASVGDAAVVVIRNTRDAMHAGTITDQQFEAAATFLEAASSQLQLQAGR